MFQRQLLFLFLFFPAGRLREPSFLLKGFSPWGVPHIYYNNKMKQRQFKIYVRENVDRIDLIGAHGTGLSDGETFHWNALVLWLHVMSRGKRTVHLSVYPVPVWGSTEQLGYIIEWFCINHPLGSDPAPWKARPDLPTFIFHLFSF